ncbi:MAG TPA: response regulator transcription factor [Burkholderiales bacterium]|nr:response regulator transcription factor [Burkholderiales bacterium]
MLALVITADPRASESDSEGPASALRDLGGKVVVVGFDLDEIDEETLTRRKPNVIVVDAGDRVDSGYAVLRKVKQTPFLQDVPTLLTVSTARLPALDFAAGGADDFVLRPIVPAELYARVRQLDWRLSAFAGEELLKAGDLLIDLAGYEVRLRGRSLVLTHQEFELLKFLAQNRGKVFTREQLLRRVWGYNYYGGSRTVDIHVRRLRAKLGKGEEALIQTVRNVGYKMKAE